MLNGVLNQFIIGLTEQHKPASMEAFFRKFAFVSKTSNGSEGVRPNLKFSFALFASGGYGQIGDNVKPQTCKHGSLL